MATQTPLLFALQSYSQLSIRPKQPTQQGLPPGSGQHSPVSSATETKDPPPKLNVSIMVAPSGIVLSWYMALEERRAYNELSTVCASGRRHNGEPSPVEEDWSRQGIDASYGLHSDLVITRQPLLDTCYRC